MRTETEIKDKIAELKHRIDLLEDNIKDCASERNWDEAQYIAEIADAVKEQIEVLEWALGVNNTYL